MPFTRPGLGTASWRLENPGPHFLASLPARLPTWRSFLCISANMEASGFPKAGGVEVPEPLPQLHGCPLSRRRDPPWNRSGMGESSSQPANSAVWLWGSLLPVRPRAKLPTILSALNFPH